MQPVADAIVADRFRLDELIGEGGMAEVWAATHLHTGKTSALKFLSSEYTGHAEARKRFLREARAASMVEHPNVVCIHDVLELEDGTLVMVMDRLVGENLGERLERLGRLSLDTTATIMAQVVSAVGSGHAVGVVHRDLKPENIFLTDGIEGVRVLDFGIAKLTERAVDGSGNLTATGSVLGTPYYMAPEQVFGEKDLDARADVWSVGVILYECLAGERPFEGENPGQILKSILASTPEPLEELVPEIPQALAAHIGKLLQRRRSARSDDLAETFEVLRGLAAGLGRSFGAARAPISLTRLDQDAEARLSLPTEELAAAAREASGDQTVAGVEREAPPPSTSSPGSGWRALLPAAVVAVGLIGAAGIWAFGRQSVETKPAASSPAVSTDSELGASGQPAATAAASTVVASPSSSSMPAAAVGSASASASRPRQKQRPTATASAKVAAPASSSNKAAPAPTKTKPPRLPAGIHGDVPF